MIKQQYSRRIPKNLRRLWQWRPDHHRNGKAVLPDISNNSQKIMGNRSKSYEDMSSKDSLLITGELSDGSRRGGSIHVPKGSIVVYVGPEFRRFVIPMSYLATPEFRGLIDKVAEEFGFEEEGGLQIPCDEQDFEQILIRCASCATHRNA